MNVTLRLDYREDGGLRVSSPDLPGLILSGEDRDTVMRQVIPAIDAIRQHSTPLDFRDSYRAINQCRTCGIEWRGPMGYVCPPRRVPGTAEGDLVMDREYKSVIPDWCAEVAHNLMQSYGFDPAVLEGAIAAALHTERERAACYVESLVDVSVAAAVPGSGESIRRTELLQTLAVDIREGALSQEPSP